LFTNLDTNNIQEPTADSLLKITLYHSFNTYTKMDLQNSRTIKPLKSYLNTCEFISKLTIEEVKE